MSEGPFTYRWRMRHLHPERYGQLCRKLLDELPNPLRAGRPSATLTFEFLDGFTAIGPRTAVRPARGGFFPRRAHTPQKTRNPVTSVSVSMQVNYEGETMPLSQAAQRAGIAIQVVVMRLRRGMPLIRALNQPVDRHK